MPSIISPSTGVNSKNLVFFACPSLDKDNVMRIVFFEKVEDKIKVRHYEKNKC